MAIIDFRVRPPSGGYLSMLLYSDGDRRDRLTRQHGFEPARSATEQSMPALIEEMDRAGVRIGVVIGRNSGPLGSISNDAVMEIVRATPGRFVGVASIDPSNRTAACREITRALSAGMRAVNIEPGSYAQPLMVDDRRLYPIYAHLEDKDVPVIIMAGGSAGPDLSYTAPENLDRVAADFPSLKIVVSHGGWPWVHQVLHIAYRRQNVFLSPDQYLAGLAGHDDYVKAANGFLSDRFIYASSYPFLPVDAYAAWFKRLPIKPEAMEKILWGNAAKLLGIDA